MLIHAVIHLLSEQWLVKLSYLKTHNLLLFVHTLPSLRRTAHFLVMMETLLFWKREQVLQTLHYKKHEMDVCLRSGVAHYVILWFSLIKVVNMLSTYFHLGKRKGAPLIFTTWICRWNFRKCRKSLNTIPQFILCIPDIVLLHFQLW